MIARLGLSSRLDSPYQHAGLLAHEAEALGEQASQMEMDSPSWNVDGLSATKWLSQHPRKGWVGKSGQGRQRNMPLLPPGHMIETRQRIFTPMPPIEIG